jgi:uncharacterized protein (TIGR03067 family)
MTLAADAKEDASKAELKRMQGDWQAVSWVVDGEKASDDDAQALFRTVKDDHYTVFQFDKEIGKGTFTIDPTTTPRTIDALPAGRTKPMLGIYELEGDTYKVCFARAGQKRPGDFTCPAGSEQVLTVWNRERK